MIEISSAMALIVIATVTYLTRIGGLLLMSRMTITPRIERSLDALAGSVLIAIVVPAAFEGDTAAKASVATAVGMMVVTKSTVAAIAAGMAVACLIRAIV